MGSDLRVCKIEPLYKQDSLCESAQAGYYISVNYVVKNF